MHPLSRLWGFLKSATAMAVLAIAAIGLSIYQGFYYERRGELSISIDAVSRVFDVYQPVGGLEISYAGENLRTAKKALWAVSFTVINSGNAEIRKVDFDDLVPFGLRFEGAQVVETPTVKTNVEYLSRNLKVATRPNFVSLSPVIFEPRDEVQISVLLLGSEASKPSIRPMGKIAGMRSIPFTSTDGRLAEKSQWEMVTAADHLWIHPIRIFLYGIGGLVGLSLILVIAAVLFTPVGKAQEWYHASRRQKRVADYKASETLNVISRRLTDLYIRRGDDALRETICIIDRIDRRGTLLAAIQDRVSAEHLQKMLRAVFPIYVDSRTFNELKTWGLITDSAPNMTYVDGLEVTTRDLGKFLQIDLSARPNDKQQGNVDRYYRSDYADRMADLLSK